jgi:hypothetical protein
MQAARHIGIDLHRNQFTCCVRLENGRNYLTDWKLENLPQFVKKLRSSDEIAVEVTGNTRLFRDTVLCEAIVAFIRRHNEHAKPFRWRKREVRGSQLQNTIINLRN